MPVGAAWVLILLFGLPGLVVAVVVLRIRSKERLRDAWLGAARAALAGVEGARPLEDGDVVLDGRRVRVEAALNPLFGPGLGVRLSACADSVDEFELRPGTPVPEGREAFAALLDRWDSAGKFGVECWAAATTLRTDLAADAKRLAGLAGVRTSKSCRGRVFTYREGFEADCPQVHWRYDLRARLPKDTWRCAVSYWVDGPLLNPVLLRLFWELAPGARWFLLAGTSTPAAIDRAFDPKLYTRRGSLLEVAHPDLVFAEDLHSDGRAFGGLIAASGLPPGFDTPVAPYAWTEALLGALEAGTLVIRRLDDDERAWYSGEYEILARTPLPVRQAIEKVALEEGATASVIDRRFNKRMVLPRIYD
jgi:hypothetical protein